MHSISYILILIICGNLFACPALAQTTVDHDELNKITNLILQKELELERLNITFRLKTMAVSPWRQRRVFLYGESNASTGEAGAIIATPVLYKYANQTQSVANPAVVSGQDISKLESANTVQLIGQSIGAGGDIFELGLNFFNYLTLKKNGFNPAMYAKRMHILRTELDGLIQDRENILNHCQTLSTSELQIAKLEGKLLKDLRDLLLIQYSQFHSSTRRFWVYQNTAFLVDLAKNSTGIAANIISLYGEHIQHPNIQGGAGLFLIINGAIILLTPAVGRVTGNLSGIAAEKTTSKELVNIQLRDLENFALHKQEFLAEIKNKEQNTPYLKSVALRQQLYEQQESLLFALRKYSRERKNESRKNLKENILFASIVGPPKVATGITNMLAGWRYPDNIPTEFKLYAAGNTANMAGSAFNMFETARVWAAIELKNHKLKNKEMLPSQQLNRKLQALEQMNQQLHDQ